MTLEINELLLNNLEEIQIKLELLEKLRMTQRQASKNYFIKNKSTIYEQRKKRKEEMADEQKEEINRKNRESARNRYNTNIGYQNVTIGS